LLALKYSSPIFTTTSAFLSSTEIFILFGIIFFISISLINKKLVAALRK